MWSVFEQENVHYEILDEIKKRKLKEGFLYPDYGNYSIAEVVPSILSNFGVSDKRATFPFLNKSKKYNNVILLIVDGLSLQHFAKYQKKFKFLNLLSSRGNVYPITSVFPSTTPAALTTLHTGLTPQEHGLPEMMVYFEEFDSVIDTLPFKKLYTADMDGLIKEGGSYQMLYEGPTVYSHLRDAKVKSFTFTSASYDKTTYSQTVQYGSETIPCESGEDMMNKAAEVILKNQKGGPAYFSLYWSMVDSSAHAFGPDSPEHVSAIANICDLMDRLLFKLSKKEVQDTLFLLTADHGQVSIRGEDIINLNKYQIIEDNFEMTKKQDKRILPTGSPHDVFLFIKPEKVDDVVDFLKTELVNRAEVFNIHEALALGLFGLNTPRSRFLKRIGNVLIIPKSGYHIWYEFLPEAPYRQLGTHGGLSEDEMIVPFAVCDLGDLIS